MHEFNDPPLLTAKRGKAMVKVTCSVCKASSTAEVKTPLVDTAVAEAKASMTAGCAPNKSAV